jgi:hypothetical protein
MRCVTVSMGAAGTHRARTDVHRTAPSTGGTVIDLSSVWSPVLKIPFDLASALVALGGERGIALFSPGPAAKTAA